MRYLFAAIAVMLFASTADAQLFGRRNANSGNCSNGSCGVASFPAVATAPNCARSQFGDPLGGVATAPAVACAPATAVQTIQTAAVASSTPRQGLIARIRARRGR